MKLYVEIDGEKHYIDEGVIEKYTLYEGYVTPFTGLKIKKEDDTKVVATEIKETETPLPAEIDDSDDSIDVVVETTPEFATVSDEPLTDAKETNEALSKSEDMDVNESATLVRE
jgi:glyceraldehyde-3-phosphate dehydrogenase/erythrose-4-phosphate dehydrogenase